MRLLLAACLALALLPSSPAAAEARDVCKQDIVTRVRTMGWERIAFHAAIGAATGAGLTMAATLAAGTSLSALAWQPYIEVPLPDSTRLLPVALLVILAGTVVGGLVWGVAGPFVTAVLEGLKC